MDRWSQEAWLDRVGEPIIVVARDGRLLVANRAARGLLPQHGLSAPLEAWPRVLGLFVADGSRLATSGELGLATALSGRAAEGVALLVRNDLSPEGTPVTFEAVPWQDDDGQAGGAVLLLHPQIASRSEVEDLRTSRLFLESIVENIPAMIFVKEARELRFERFNRAGEELLGMKREVLLGKNDYDFFPREQADHFQRLDRETLQHNELIDIPEEPIQTRSGERWLHTKKIPIRDDQGTPLYLLGISLDITARKLAEDALKRAHDELEVRVLERTAELEQANASVRLEIQERLKAEAALRQSQKMEAIGRLAGGVAHDFNNMLTAILGYARLLADREGLEAEAARDIEQIVLAAERAAGLTRQLLAFSRQQVMKPVVLDLGDVVRVTEDMLRRLVREDVDLRVVREEGLGHVRADPGQMEQVILNLVVNARDAMPSGGRLTIRTSNEVVPEGSTSPAVPPGEYACLSVTDTGVGIPHEILPKIFEPFFTTKPHGQGTGLGLSTAFGIVRQSGGDLVVQSAPGAGSCFRVFLPRVAGNTPPDESAAPAVRPVPAAGVRNVLLVEDEPLVRKTACALLESLGMTVLQAADPTEALELFAGHRDWIELLITDVVMPVMGGGELATRLRREKPGLRVVYMSGHTNTPPGRDAGTAFLQKPFTPAALAASIREATS